MLPFWRITFDIVYSYLAYEKKYIKIGSQFLFIPFIEGTSSDNKQISLILSPRGENFIFLKLIVLVGFFFKLEPKKKCTNTIKFASLVQNSICVEKTN